MGIVNGWSRVLIGAATLALAACADGPPPPTVVELTMAPAADANFYQNSAAPVQVRVYQLKSPAAFEDADYYLLANSESDVLGDDLLGKAEYFLMPGVSQIVVSEKNPDTRYLGLVAAFRNIDGAIWRDTVAVPLNKTTTVTANIGAQTVTLE